jgi:peptidoglycan/xylan/chitin deacetylase (PgdA/CDA1 family)
MNPVVVAAKGKGAVNVARRAGVIGARYGFDPRRMERRVATVLELVERHGGGATLPITAAPMGRNPQIASRYADLGIEFAIHGYYHVDHAGMTAEEQIDQAGRARRLMLVNGIDSIGFRAPYLRSNAGTLIALRESGFVYDSSQAMHWSIRPDLETDAYRRALTFYGSLSAEDYPVLPWLEDEVVRIPCCLPDDESVVERLRIQSVEAIADLWLDVWRRTDERGELFTMQVHPERIGRCGPGVAAVLDAAASSGPAVWRARMDEIARWWRDRSAATVDVRDDGRGRFRLRCRGPDGLTVLVRNLDVSASEPWSNGYRRVRAVEFDAAGERRPFIGVHPTSPERLISFLRQQGYVVERAGSGSGYSFFLRRERFSRADERNLLDQIEAGTFPLIRFGRWPNAARSALAVTGDVDALTIWDYALRFIGR